MIIIRKSDLHSDPELKVGGYVWLERSDGRSVWRQRLRVLTINSDDDYVLVPVEITE